MRAFEFARSEKSIHGNIMKHCLEIKNLTVVAEGKTIVRDASIAIRPGELVILMGKNGSGKSTFVNAVLGHPKYTVTSGKILLEGKNILDMKTDARARAGIFLSVQSPVAIPGVTLMNFLRSAWNAVHPEKQITAMDFFPIVKEHLERLKMPVDFAYRPLNDGFSGGEKKKAEMLQMSILRPKFALLDEIDSGLDRDAREVVLRAIDLLRKEGTGFLIITHYASMAEALKPDRVFLMEDGRITREGTIDLAREIEKKGYGEDNSKVKNQKL